MLGRDTWKSRPKLEKLSFLQENQRELFQFCPGRIEAPLLHILDPNYPSFYLKRPRKCQDNFNFDIFQAVSQICTSPLLNFRVDLKFDHIPLCVYY